MPEAHRCPHYLWFLILSFSMAMVLANWFDIRLIRLGSINTDAGTLIFPLTFILTDLITEVYGYQQARRAIWCGFLFNFIFIAYGYLVTHLPSPDYAVVTNAEFDAMHAFNFRIILASTISYLCAEPLNAYLMAKLKIYFKGRQLAMRFVFSTGIASLLDSLIFGSIAFAGMMPDHELKMLILTMWLLKVIIEVIGLPLSLYLTNLLKMREKMDIYDTRTNFNLFRLQVNESSTDNKFA